MEFLADEGLIDRCQGVRRVLGEAKKHDAPILRSEKPWEDQRVDVTFSPLYDPDRKVYRLWYRAYMSVHRDLGDQSKVDSSERDKANRRMFLCYAESPDGIQWHRPELGLYDFQGSKANNILSEIKGDTVWTNILLDPDDPDPARRFKAIGYGGGGRTILERDSQAGIAVAFSADGLQWSEGTTVMDGWKDVTDLDCVLPVREPTTGRWVGFFRPRTRPKRRFIGYSESDDFIHWTYPRMLLAPDAEDTHWTEFYGMAAAPIGNRRIGLLWVYQNHPEHSVMTNELVYSRHGIDYARVMPRHQFLPLGQDGETDSRRAWPTRLLERDDEILIYYNASNVEHGSDRVDETTAGWMQRGRVAEGEEPVHGIGLARLPWGHFCGLRADREGLVETRWLHNYGAKGVSVVADIRPGGYLRAEILNVYGQVMPGWEAEKSTLEPGPRGTYLMRWGSGLDGRYGQQSPDGEEIQHVLKVRLYLYRATLFGVSVGEEGLSPETTR